MCHGDKNKKKKLSQFLNYNEYGVALKCYMPFSTQKLLHQCEQMCVFYV